MGWESYFNDDTSSEEAEQSTLLLGNQTSLIGNIDVSSVVCGERVQFDVADPLGLTGGVSSDRSGWNLVQYKINE